MINNTVEIMNFVMIVRKRPEPNRIESNRILARIYPEPNQNSNRTRIRSGFNSDTKSNWVRILIRVRVRFGFNSSSVRS